VRALLQDATVLQDDDARGVADGGEAVGDDEAGVTRIEAYSSVRARMNSGVAFSKKTTVLVSVRSEASSRKLRSAQ
jgi:hypothetical protein